MVDLTEGRSTSFGTALERSRKPGETRIGPSWLRPSRFDAVAVWLLASDGSGLLREDP
jgi:hypothetical protein